MSKITSDQVVHVAKLAQLSLTPEEITKFQAQLSEIVTFIDQLSSVDINQTPPTSQTTGLMNVFRPDQINSLALLPQEGYFKVKAILKKDSP